MIPDATPDNEATEPLSADRENGRMSQVATRQQTTPPLAMDHDPTETEFAKVAQESIDTEPAKAAASADAEAFGRMLRVGPRSEPPGTGERTRGEPPADTDGIDSLWGSPDEGFEPPEWEVDPEPLRPPPPPSLRPATARRTKCPPLGITANLPPPTWPSKTVADLMTRKLIAARPDFSGSGGDLDTQMQCFRGVGRLRRSE
ncbi:MAG: hypothetical protein JW751_17140, partial [Polyangiaceae bacterium]|nr:hypothetical protein [Polyangiaceae bacterium]